MMTSFGKQVTYVFGIHFVQEVIKNNETRFALWVAQIFRYALVKLNVPPLRGQLSRRNG
jgi:hypothetical protein